MAEEPPPGERPVAESPKAEKKQAGREKLIVGGTLALVVLTFMIWRRSQAKATPAQGYPLGYGSSGGGGGGAPSSGSSTFDPGALIGGALTPTAPPPSGTQPANQTPGPGSGPTVANTPPALVYSDPSYAALPVTNPQPAALTGVFGATPLGDISAYPNTTPLGSIQAPPGGVFSSGQWNGDHLVSGTYQLPNGTFQTVHS